MVSSTSIGGSYSFPAAENNRHDISLLKSDLQEIGKLTDGKELVLKDKKFVVVDKMNFLEATIAYLFKGVRTSYFGKKTFFKGLETLAENIGKLDPKDKTQLKKEIETAAKAIFWMSSGRSIKTENKINNVVNALKSTIPDSKGKEIKMEFVSISRSTNKKTGQPLASSSEKVETLISEKLVKRTPIENEILQTEKTFLDECKLFIEVLSDIESIEHSDAELKSKAVVVRSRLEECVKISEKIVKDCEEKGVLTSFLDHSEEYLTALVNYLDETKKFEEFNHKSTEDQKRLLESHMRRTLKRKNIQNGKYYWTGLCILPFQRATRIPLFLNTIEKDPRYKDKQDKVRELQSSAQQKLTECSNREAAVSRSHIPSRKK